MQEEEGGPYKASVPLRHATTPEADVLLAYEMNGKVWGPLTNLFEHLIFKASPSLLFWIRSIPFSRSTELCFFHVLAGAKPRPWVSFASDCSRCHWGQVCEMVRDHHSVEVWVPGNCSFYMCCIIWFPTPIQWLYPIWEAPNGSVLFCGELVGYAEYVEILNIVNLILNVLNGSPLLLIALNRVSLCKKTTRCFRHGLIGTILSGDLDVRWWIFQCK